MRKINSIDTKKEKRLQIHLNILKNWKGFLILPKYLTMFNREFLVSERKDLTRTGNDLTLRTLQRDLKELVDKGYIIKKRFPAYGKFKEFKHLYDIKVIKIDLIDKKRVKKTYKKRVYLKKTYINIPKKIECLKKPLLKSTHSEAFFIENTKISIQNLKNIYKVLKRQGFLPDFIYNMKFFRIINYIYIYGRQKNIRNINAFYYASVKNYYNWDINNVKLYKKSEFNLKQYIDIYGEGKRLDIILNDIFSDKKSFFDAHYIIYNKYYIYIYTKLLNKLESDVARKKILKHKDKIQKPPLDTKTSIKDDEKSNKQAINTHKSNTNKIYNNNNLHITGKKDA